MSLLAGVLLFREESDPRYITNATDVKLRSFTTKASIRDYTFCIYVEKTINRAHCNVTVLNGDRTELCCFWSATA